MIKSGYGLWLFLFAWLHIASAQQPIQFKLAPVSQARSVHLVGDFNQWSKTLTPMEDADGDGIWEVTVPLDPGVYQYRYLIDGMIWIKDPANPIWAGEHSNSVITIVDPRQPQLRNLNPAFGEMLFRDPITIAAEYVDGIKGLGLDLSATKVLLNRQPLNFSYHPHQGKIESLVTGIEDGEYEVEIFAADRAGNAASPLRSYFWLNKQNQPPIVEAGPTIIARLHNKVTLNQWIGFDPDYEPIQGYQWKMVSKPTGSKAKLSKVNIPFPTFTPDKIGRYILTLRISDGRLLSNIDSVDVYAFSHRDHPVEFRLSNATVSARDRLSIVTAAVAGEFNRWSPKANSMVDLDRDGIWTAWLDLDPGEYEYKFVVNDSLWIPDPDNQRQVPDGWNGYNSVITTPPRLSPIAIVHSKLGPGKIIFDAAASRSPLGQPLDFHWLQDVNNPQKFALPLAPQFILPMPKLAGNYHYHLVVTDQLGGSDHRDVVLTVNQDMVRLWDFNESPDWAKDAIIYEIFVRQFTASGDLHGVIEKIDYLRNLGINCIWLMPIWDGPTSHGYGPSDFFRIESDYGTLDDFQSLVTAAHHAGIKIILDFIANHTSDQHRYFLAAYHSPTSPFRNWYRWKSNRAAGYYRYEFHNDWDTLPNLNYENPNVRQYILSAAHFWAALGVDGFRCDVAWGVPHDFWKIFRRSLKNKYPDLLLLDEVLPRTPAYHQAQFDISYDSDFYGNLLDVMTKRKPLSAIENGLAKTKKNYPAEALDFRYIENHDMDRFIAQFGLNKTKLAAALLLTIPGTPLIYYGQELGLMEKTPPMKWEWDDNPLFDFYQKLIHLRRRHPCLRRGDMIKLTTNAELEVYAYLRSHQQDQVLVVLNFSDRNQDCSIALPAEIIHDSNQNELRLENVISGEPIHVPIVASDQIKLPLAPETPYVFLVKN